MISAQSPRPSLRWPGGLSCSIALWSMTLLPIFALAGCNGAAAKDYRWIDRDRISQFQPGQGAFRVRWKKDITRRFEGDFTVIERASAALDPAHNRVFIGDSEGHFLSFTSEGGLAFEYDAKAPIDAPAVVDTRSEEVFVGTEDGTMHALRARDGAKQWTAELGGPLRTAPVLSDDVIYAATDDDQVVALSRKDGEVVWRYDREYESEDLSVAGHAGVTLIDRHLLTASTDGVVVALDPGDGSVQWERDTSLDLPSESGGVTQFLDVDTTPAVVDDKVYAASFSGGLYALELSNGSVVWREPDILRVSGITTVGDWLVLASAIDGVVVVHRQTRKIYWKHPVGRGAPTAPIVTDNGLVLVGESKGSFLAIALRDGTEVARLSSDHGFGAPAVASGRLGFVLSNGGGFFAFDLL